MINTYLSAQKSMLPCACTVWHHSQTGQSKPEPGTSLVECGSEGFNYFITGMRRWVFLAVKLCFKRNFPGIGHYSYFFQIYSFLQLRGCFRKERCSYTFPLRRYGEVWNFPQGEEVLAQVREHIQACNSLFCVHISALCRRYTAPPPCSGHHLEHIALLHTNALHLQQLPCFGLLPQTLNSAPLPICSNSLCTG